MWRSISRERLARLAEELRDVVESLQEDNIKGRDFLGREIHDPVLLDSMVGEAVDRVIEITCFLHNAHGKAVIEIERAERKLQRRSKAREFIPAILAQKQIEAIFEQDPDAIREAVKRAVSANRSAEVRGGDSS